MKRLRTIVVAMFAVLIAGAYALPAGAVDGSSAALSIVPKKNYSIKPGGSVKDKLIIRNLSTTQSLHLTLRVIDFTYYGEDGTPKLFLAKDAPQTTWSLKPFMTVGKSVDIGPGKSKSVPMRIAIPAGHGAGSYYSAIIYSGGPGQGSGQVGLSASGVTLVFVTVPGKVKEDIQLKKLGAYDTGSGSYHFIMTQTPKNIGYTIQNKGNVVESPVGSITLKDMFGHTTTIDDVNPASSLALIGQTRTFTPCIKYKTDGKTQGSQMHANGCDTAPLWPGLYHATVDLFYGQNGNNTQEVVKNAVFWYLPWWFIIIMLIIIAVIAYYIWKFTRKVKGKVNGPKRLSRRR